MSPTSTFNTMTWFSKWLDQLFWTCWLVILRRQFVVPKKQTFPKKKLLFQNHKKIFNWLDFKFILKKIINSSLINFRSLKIYIIVNFRTHEISRDAHKLAWTPKLFLKKKKNSYFKTLICSYDAFRRLVLFQTHYCALMYTDS
jgi:hypothetical protein